MPHRTTNLAGTTPHSKRGEWLTPPNIIEALAPFDLDPCAARGQPWRTAERMMTPEENGLSRSWGTSFVWCSPPQGRLARPWLEKLARHKNGIALVYAATDTDLFFEFVWGRADAVLFLEGRLYFHEIDGRRASTNCGCAVALVAYGDEATRRLNRCGLTGSFVTDWRTIEGRCVSEVA